MNRASTFPLRDRIAVALLALALVARVLVPAGWMPAEGRGLAITLCSGGSAVAAWVDAAGKVHKGDHQPAGAPDHPCAFAGLGAPMLGGEVFPAILPASASDEAASLALTPAAVGRGLAAPPPPATGPPATA
ncbi:MAG: hypothetical protein V4574_03075 [Pseudomonadota bacterium]